MQTIDELIRQRAGDERVGPGLRRPDLDPRPGGAGPGRAGRLLASLRRPGPFHVALMLDNVPEFVFWMGGAALAGAVMVGGNPTHRGDELARDLVPHRVPVAGDQLRVPHPGRGARPRPGPAARADPGRRRPAGDVRPDPTTGYGALLRGAAGAPAPRPGRDRASPTRRSATCCSPRAPRGHPRPACAARAAWPGSAPPWPRCSS